MAKNAVLLVTLLGCTSEQPPKATFQPSQEVGHAVQATTDAGQTFMLYDPRKKP